MNEELKKSLYSTVSRPARYVGGEYNQPNVEKAGAMRMCFCFPDIYEIGMSNLGIRILYGLVNEKKNWVAERCFAPWVDLREKLQKTGTPLLSVETASPLKDFDFLGFSLQYELSYTNVLMMFELSGIPFLAKDRGEDFPLIMAGGPCMANPEPVADFFDIMMIGEGEDSLSELLDLIEDCKKKGMKKSEIIPLCKSVQGVTAPSIDKPIYENGRIVGFTGSVKKAVVKDLDKAYFPVKPLIPSVEAVHDRAVLELYRGCANGCRYCQAGFYYRPIRVKSEETLYKQGCALIRNGGFEEMSLSSLSTGDYKDLNKLLSDLSPIAEANKVHLALPSLRVDSFKSVFAKEARRTSLTFAPEAGTQRLRDVINKNVTEEDIMTTMSNAFSMGYATVKLYFMMGLPTETDEDIKGIIDLVERIKELYPKYRNNEKAIRINVSVNTFIPKPVTPFQWEGLISFDEIKRRQNILREGLRIKGVTLSWNDAENSVMEAIFSRGDRKLSGAIISAYKKGCVFDAWTEYFKFDLWQEAFRECNIDVNEYLRKKDVSEILPHEYIDVGISREYFIKELEKAERGERTPSCKNGCVGCGAKKLGECKQ